MRKLKYDNTVKQQADVICYAFSPDLLGASERELKSFLKVLSQYFPKTDNGEGGYKPMDNQALHGNFNSAHRHVCELIASKREKKRHLWVLGVSIGTFLVLSATLWHRIEYQRESTLNKSIQPTAEASVD
ncbi:hypothetical protein [Pseudidiomarina sp.]|uniref:hypothetical protein n=1 Tax=Pseudidiomarina sp. TaxID=2081707 RepID=UPI003A97E808